MKKRKQKKKGPIYAFACQSEERERPRVHVGMHAAQKRREKKRSCPSMKKKRRRGILNFMYKEETKRRKGERSIGISWMQWWWGLSFKKVGVPRRQWMRSRAAPVLRVFLSRVALAVALSLSFFFLLSSSLSLSSSHSIYFTRLAALDGTETGGTWDNRKRERGRA